MKIRHTLFVLAFSATALPLHAASFDCKKASTLVEKAICADPKLSALDDHLSQSYAETIDSVSDAASLKVAQKAWLQERNKCQTPACVSKAYQARIALLDTFSETFSGILLAGGGEDAPYVTVKSSHGNSIHIYCREVCDKLFQPSNEGYELKPKLKNQPVVVSTARKFNNGMIAGPGDDATLTMLTKITFINPIK